jgi:FtsZ-binding cell division protein ZapB
MSSPYLEHIAELEVEIEELRDTIEIIVAERAGISRQRDELARQLTIAIEKIEELNKIRKAIDS